MSWLQWVFGFCLFIPSTMAAVHAGRVSQQVSILDTRIGLLERRVTRGSSNTGGTSTHKTESVSQLASAWRSLISMEVQEGKRTINSARTVLGLLEQAQEASTTTSVPQSQYPTQSGSSGQVLTFGETGVSWSPPPVSTSQVPDTHGCKKKDHCPLCLKAFWNVYTEKK